MKTGIFLPYFEGCRLRDFPEALAGILDKDNVCYYDGVYQLGSDPFRSLGEMVFNPSAINPQFEELCRACIADGAEVIIPACAALSPATSFLGYKEVPGTGVPVIDVTQAAVKMAEVLADLKRSIGLGKSQRNAYKSVPAKVRDRMRSLTKCME